MAGVTLLGVDLSALNFKLVAYVLFCIVFVIGTTFMIFSADTLARAVIYVVGAILVLVFFGMRWFGNAEQPSGIWPPTINMCPDYLTFVPTISGAPRGGCVDFLGVSTQDGAFLKSQKSDLSSMTSGSTNKFFEFTANDVQNARDAASMRRICDRCRSAGLTWEGIWDGDVCVGLNRFMARKVINEAKKCA